MMSKGANVFEPKLKHTWERIPQKVLKKDLKEQQKLIKDMKQNREMCLNSTGILGLTVKPYKRVVHQSHGHKKTLWKGVKDEALRTGSEKDDAEVASNKATKDDNKIQPHDDMEKSKFSRDLMSKFSRVDTLQEQDVECGEEGEKSLERLRKERMQYSQYYKYYIIYPEN